MMGLALGLLHRSLPPRPAPVVRCPGRKPFRSRLSGFGLLTAVAFFCSGCASAGQGASFTPPPAECRRLESHPSAQAGRWELVFGDDFSGSSLDEGRWTTCYWWDDDGCTNDSNRPLQWYQPDDVLVDDGVLRLRARERSVTAPDGRRFRYTSGMITSGRDTSDTAAPARFTFRYGYAEIRARVPAGQGLWPAFWLLPATHESKPEIDVMELLGHAPDTVEMHIHYRPPLADERSRGDSWRGPDFSEDWHTFAVDWRPSCVVWYVDGVERWRYADASTVAATPMYLIANLAVGGEWPGPPDDETPFPSYFEIDHIKVWQDRNIVSLRAASSSYTDASARAADRHDEDVLLVDANPRKASYLRFDLGPLPADRLASAGLIIHTTADPGAASGSRHRVAVAEPDACSPPVGGLPEAAVVVGEIPGARRDEAVHVPLDKGVLRSHLGSELCVILLPGGDDGLDLHSSEIAGKGPELVLDFE